MQLPLLFGLLVASQSLSWGAISACATSASGNTMASYGASSASNGCSEIDKTFTNLSLDSATGTSPMTTSNIGIWASGTSPVGDSLGPVTVNFDSIPGNAWRASGKGVVQDTTFSYVISAQTGGSFPTPATPGLVWAIDSLQLVVTATQDSNSDAASTVTLSFCLDATTTSGCANLGTIVASFSSGNATTYTCSFAGCVSPTGSTVNFASITQIAISESVHLSGDTTNGHLAAISNIANTFGETTSQASVPEPSSLLLMGVGLGLLGVFHLKRR